ncbi:DNA polymerase delta subunit 4-like [Porites lutea]|uniref:DNA polymerase delta subunit 4-like n=1 Tax=Porites lutea TaxID=51062 RepID=UPI003CC59E37
MAMASSTRLVTDSFPKTKKDRPINQKLKQSKAKDVIHQKDQKETKDQELNLEKALLVLKEFDLDSEYGPCIGITRLERWERAEEYGLYPPREVKSIILQHPNDTTFTECVWYNSNI